MQVAAADTAPQLVAFVVCQHPVIDKPLEAGCIKHPAVEDNGSVFAGSLAQVHYVFSEIAGGI